MAGELKSLGAEAVVLATEAGSRRVARESVAVLSMNPELQVVSRRAPRHVRVGFVDGSRLTAAWPKAVAGELVRLVNDDSARGELGRQAQQYALSEFAWPAVAGKYLEVYSDIAA